MNNRLSIGLLVPLLLASHALADAQVMGPLEAFTLEDQHGVSHEVDKDTRILLFSRDMDGGKLLKAALSEIPEGFLDERRAVYVTDISEMPRLVAKLFALPSMRKRPYPILLDRDGQTTEQLPSVEGQATVLFLSGLEITRVEHASTAHEILDALED